MVQNSEEFDVPITDTAVKGYRNAVYPDRVRQYAREILNDTDPGPHRYNYAARFVQYLHEELEYESNNDLWRADYILEHSLNADCEDTATCLVSLLQARSLTARYVIVHIDGDDSSHLMAEVLIETDPAVIASAADEFYEGSISNVFWEAGDDDGCWIVCDPVNYPVAGHLPSEFCYAKKSGEIAWKEDVAVDHIGL